MSKISQLFSNWRAKQDKTEPLPSARGLSPGLPLEIVRATRADIPFVFEGYTAAHSGGAVATVPNLREYLEHCVAVSNRTAKPMRHTHPFIEGQRETRPIDDIFILKMVDAAVGVLWLRDHNDRHLAPERFGELIFLWIRPDKRGLKCWPHVAEFSRIWAANADKTHLVGRCLKPSRRMAHLFEHAGFECDGVSASGSARVESSRRYVA